MTNNVRVVAIIFLSMVSSVASGQEIRRIPKGMP